MYDDHIRYRSILDDRDDFLKAMEESCNFMSDQSLFARFNSDYSIREKYIQFSKLISDHLIDHYYFGVRPNEFFGLRVMGQAIAGMAIAARVAGQTSPEVVSRALQNKRTTRILLDLTDKGTVSSQLRQGHYIARVARMEVIMGLKETRGSEPEKADVEAFQNLSTAFTYVPSDEGDTEPFFRVSASTADRLAEVVNYSGEKENVCPMRSNVERIFCLLADSACRNEDLVPYDLSFGVVRPSGLIVPSHIS